VFLHLVETWIVRRKQDAGGATDVKSLVFRMLFQVHNARGLRTPDKSSPESTTRNLYYTRKLTTPQHNIATGGSI
jgi:hypothetical protein